MKRLALIFCILTFNMVLFGQKPTILMRNAKIMLCEAIIKDSETGLTPLNYGHNENFILTISVAGAKSLTLTFSSFCTEKDADILRIFDGKDTNATLIGKWSGTVGPGTITSKDSFITLHFKSDKSVACSGWEADLSTIIIPPPIPKLTVSGALTCKSTSIKITSDVAITCDSFLIKNATLTGPKALGISSITPTNCVNGKTKTFTINFLNAVDLNGTYNFNLTTKWKDFCGKIYTYNALVNFVVNNCPLKVILTATDTTICKGTCVTMVATVSGGDPSKYIYTWTTNPATAISGKGPYSICVTANTTFILRVTDGISIPSGDTINFTVLNPPKAQPDTLVCYKSNNFKLRSITPGGKWFGNGIVDSLTGEFNPRSFTGTRKVWYNIGKCSDTVIVNSTNTWSLNNTFCANTGPKGLWWFGPNGGTWSGLRVTSNGIFNPDTANGIYTLTYNWNGCTVNKNVEIVGKLAILKFDTTCQSLTKDFLTIAPAGIYPNWFPGLLNGYTGEFNPSLMGGPKNYLIIFNAGGCKDTTKLTVLEINAGKRDTFCPNSGIQLLTGIKPISNYKWTMGKGIVKNDSNAYNPAFSNYKPAIDTLEITSGKCKDRKYIHIIKTKVNRTDTIRLCYTNSPIKLTNANTGNFPLNGNWSGPGIYKKDSFSPALAGYGMHTLTYTTNGCSDSFYIFIRPKPIVQTDTAVCINSLAFNCRPIGKGGSFWGNGITNNYTGIFNPAVAGVGLHWIVYYSNFGCYEGFTVKVDSLPIISFNNLQRNYCYKNSLFPLIAQPSGGIYSGNGVIGTNFNPTLAGSGLHSIKYTIIQQTCNASRNVNLKVLDTLKLILEEDSGNICPGEIIWLKAQGEGGIPIDYGYTWSNGKTGTGTFVAPTQSTTFNVVLTDNCSDPVTKIIPVNVNPRPYFNVITSAPICFGGIGWAEALFPNYSDLKLNWNTFPSSTLPKIVANAGSKYRLSATYIKTGCTNDTSVTIPGYKAIDADFTTYIANGDVCLSSISNTLQFFDNSIGGKTGMWHFGDGTKEAYIPGQNPSHLYEGNLKNYPLKLVIKNEGGCTDSALSSICYKDTVLMFFPNALKLSSIHKNTEFFLSSVGLSEFKIIISNRWGQQVFTSKSLNFKWDGKFMGKNCVSGVYVYYVEYKSKQSGWLQTRGSLHIFE